jgi:Ca2+-binding RTX toxin-like protein
MLGTSRLFRAVSSGALVFAAAVVLAPAASAGVASCTYDSGTKTVTVDYPSNDGEDHTIARDIAGAITVDGSSCQGATVTNTDTIKAPNGFPGHQSLTIDETNGPFAPGATAEATGVSEIEFVITMGQGTDDVTITGTPQADKITLASATKARLNGDTDADITFGDTENFSVNAGGGNDRVTVKLATDGTIVYGGDGNDRLTGGLGVDGLNGEGGKDTIVGGDGGDTIDAGQGDDTLTGGQGNDTMFPGNGNDTVSGGPGPDALEMASIPDGADTVSGGTGQDTADYSTRASSVTVTLDDVADDVAPGEGDNIASDIEGVYTGSGTDTLTGSDGDNYLDGGESQDLIQGGDGDDILVDGAGDDFLFGGNGSDSMYTNQGDDVASGDGGSDTILTSSVSDGADSYDGGSGTDAVVYSSRSGDLTLIISGTHNGEAGENDIIGSNIETIYGGSGNDTIVGSLADNQLIGGGGNDTIDGGAGKDSISGDTGNDALTAGDGADYVDAGDGDDTLHLTDGGVDTGFCAGGNDTATDRDTIDNIFNCEVT